MFSRSGFASRHESGSAGIFGSERAALDVTLRAPRAIGKNLAARGTVFGRIGINEQGGSALAFGSERLEAAITVGIRVADKNDLAFHADAVISKKIVIFGIAAVRVDDFGSDVAGCGIAKIRTGDGGILRVQVGVVRVFAQGRRERDRRGHFKRDAARARVQNIVAAERNVFPSLLAPFVRDEISELIVAVGSSGM